MGGNRPFFLMISQWKTGQEKGKRKKNKKNKKLSKATTKRDWYMPQWNHKKSGHTIPILDFGKWNAIGPPARPRPVYFLRVQTIPCKQRFHSHDVKNLGPLQKARGCRRFPVMEYGYRAANKQCQRMPFLILEIDPGIINIRATSGEAWMPDIHIGS